MLATATARKPAFESIMRTSVASHQVGCRCQECLAEMETRRESHTVSPLSEADPDYCAVSPPSPCIANGEPRQQDWASNNDHDNCPHGENVGNRGEENLLTQTSFPQTSARAEPSNFQFPIRHDSLAVNQQRMTRSNDQQRKHGIIPCRPGWPLQDMTPRSPFASNNPFKPSDRVFAPINEEGNGSEAYTWEEPHPGTRWSPTLDSLDSNVVKVAPSGGNAPLPCINSTVLSSPFDAQETSGSGSGGDTAHVSSGTAQEDAFQSSDVARLTTPELVGTQQDFFRSSARSNENVNDAPCSYFSPERPTMKSRMRYYKRRLKARHTSLKESYSSFVFPFESPIFFNAVAATTIVVFLICTYIVVAILTLSARGISPESGLLIWLGLSACFFSLALALLALTVRKRRATLRERHAEGQGPFIALRQLVRRRENELRDLEAQVETACAANRFFRRRIDDHADSSPRPLMRR